MFEALDSKDQGYITLNDFTLINDNKLPLQTLKEVYK